MAPTLRTVRSASLSGYPDLAQSLGLNAPALLRQAGLPPRSLDDPETLISADAVAQLLEDSAQASGTEDFGLRLAAGRTLSHLGPIGLVMRAEPTALEALNTLFRYRRLLNASLLTRLDCCADTITIRESLLVQRAFSIRQSTELALGVMFRILKELLGPEWQPMRVAFMHRPPRDEARHKAFFGPTLVFNQDFDGMVCSAAQLNMPLHHSDPRMARFAQRLLDQALSRQPQEAHETVRQLIVALLPAGRCTAQHVAAHLGVDRRTLHRHLGLEGLTFSSLLDQVRQDLVQRQLEASDLPLNEVAGLLGFSAPSAFAYWFRLRFGCSASAWRRGQDLGRLGAPPGGR